MNDEIKKLVVNKKLITYRVLDWIGLYTKGEVCNMLNFSRPTLDRRLKIHNWKYSEIETITKKMPF
jgi:hypothetical protein